MLRNEVLPPKRHILEDLLDIIDKSLVFANADPGTEIRTEPLRHTASVVDAKVGNLEVGTVKYWPSWMRFLAWFITFAIIGTSG